ncbi:MAG: phosphatase PAP2 family protein [Gemmatimonadota bacterium]|nr:phosphatase PAP2 family protein [Gemmatimonadota bacterium]
MMRNRNIAFLLSLALPGALAAQQPRDSMLPSPRPSVRWYHAVAALGAISVASLLDESFRDHLQAHRTAGKDDVARVFRRMGQPEVYAVMGLGTIATGLFAGDPRITRSGERITAGLLLAGVTSSALKLAVGRGRPGGGAGAYDFHPFSGDDAWPSGHTTMAFALAAGVSDELHSTPATIALYSAATMTAWSRLNDDRHWLSDVLTGAAVGVTSAKLMNGHWRVFGITGPRFLLSPGTVGVNLRF